MRHCDNMPRLLPMMLKLLYEKSGKELFQPLFFQPTRSKILDSTFIIVKPVAQMELEKGKVELGYDVGTRGNGTDSPVWPKNLTVEVVKVEEADETRGQIG